VIIQIQVNNSVKEPAKTIKKKMGNSVFHHEKAEEEEVTTNRESN